MGKATVSAIGLISYQQATPLITPQWVPDGIASFVQRGSIQRYAPHASVTLVKIYLIDHMQRERRN